MQKSNERVAVWLSEATPAPLLISSSAEQSLRETILTITATANEVIVIDPLDKSITIAAVRDIKHTATQTTWVGQRIIIISEAERLTDPAASALLKILEEPPAATRFILSTRWPQRLLATIRSRCQHIRLGNVKENKTTTPAPALDLLQLLATYAKESEIDSEQLQHIWEQLDLILRTQGTSPELKRAYQRLRDYYYIDARPGGTKLAKDVLLASLPS